jgi:hypothetical protein
MATGALSSADLNLLRPYLTPVPLKLRQELEKPNRRINDVYFIDAGMVSVVAVQNPAKLVEVGLIGCEGMSGTSAVLGGQSSPHLTYLQVAGDGQHISTNARRVVHVLITDIQLGGSASDWDVAEAFRASSSDVGVIYTTGNSHDRRRSVPNSLHFTKPYQPADVATACRELVTCE